MVQPHALNQADSPNIFAHVYNINKSVCNKVNKYILIEYVNMIFVTSHIDFMNKCGLCGKQFIKGSVLEITN